MKSFRPLSGSYISQYHPRNPMSCLGRIGGLRGKSNFIEIQLFWKVKSSYKSSISAMRGKIRNFAHLRTECSNNI